MTSMTVYISLICAIAAILVLCGFLVSLYRLSISLGFCMYSHSGFFFISQYFFSRNDSNHFISQHQSVHTISRSLDVESLHRQQSLSQTSNQVHFELPPPSYDEIVLDIRLTSQSSPNTALIF